MRRYRFGPGVPLNQWLHCIGVWAMHDQGVKARPALGRVDARDGPVLGRVRTQAIDRLGRERDEAARPQAGGGAGDARRIRVK